MTEQVMPDNDASQTGAARRRGGWPLMLALPVTIFAALAAVFVVALYTGDPSRVPSALIGKPAPQFDLPQVVGLVTPQGDSVPGFSRADLATGDVVVVNVWASWCGPCHTEHPLLVALAERSKARMLAINYKDKPEDARRFLGRYGNPFARVGADTTGRVAIEWGVYGVPETFILDGQGHIVYKHVGPITPEVLESRLLPVIAKARKS
jgi:cytochrome c biogenesis protein CcmG/thiol:disulfide interchange protein DsbE